MILRFDLKMNANKDKNKLKIFYPIINACG